MHYHPPSCCTSTTKGQPTLSTSRPVRADRRHCHRRRWLRARGRLGRPGPMWTRQLWQGQQQQQRRRQHRINSSAWSRVGKAPPAGFVCGTGFLGDGDGGGGDDGCDHDGPCPPVHHLGIGGGGGDGKTFHHDCRPMTRSRWLPRSVGRVYRAGGWRRRKRNHRGWTERRRKDKGFQHCWKRRPQLLAAAAEPSQGTRRTKTTTTRRTVAILGDTWNIPEHTVYTYIYTGANRARVFGLVFILFSPAERKPVRLLVVGFLSFNCQIFPVRMCVHEKTKKKRKKERERERKEI